jgi:hypothetical protein
MSIRARVKKLERARPVPSELSPRLQRFYEHIAEVIENVCGSNALTPTQRAHLRSGEYDKLFRTPAGPFLRDLVDVVDALEQESRKSGQPEGTPTRVGD